MKYSQFNDLLQQCVKSSLLDDVKFLDLMLKLHTAVGEKIAEVDGKIPEHATEHKNAMDGRIKPEFDLAYKKFERILRDKHQDLITRHDEIVNDPTVFTGIDPADRGRLTGSYAGIGIELDQMEIEIDTPEETVEPASESYNMYVDYMSRRV